MVKKRLIHSLRASFFCLIFILSYSTVLGDEKGEAVSGNDVRPETEMKEAEEGEKEETTQNESEVAELYKSAFKKNIKLSERKALLKSVINKHPHTGWAEDAMWILSRMARMKGQKTRSVLWLRNLVEKYPNPSLEKFTMSSPLFRTSRIPRILFLVETHGRRYAHTNEGGRVYAFNPLPFSIYEELGQAYGSFGFYELAEEMYRKALKELPPVEILQNMIRERIDAVQITDPEDKQ